MQTSAGLILTDRKVMLACIPYGKSKYSKNFMDLPKGRIEEGEDPHDAVIREVKEETGLTIHSRFLNNIGLFTYLEEKNLHLFYIASPKLPPLKMLKCTSYFTNEWGKKVPEVVGYQYIPLQEIDKYFYRKLVPIIQKAISYIK
jgi:8-oxo-dGTP pyrophosphatase MutT (NUDIX family)